MIFPCNSNLRFEKRNQFKERINLANFSKVPNTVEILDKWVSEYPSHYSTPTGITCNI